MKPEDARRRVEEIAAMAPDYERQHSAEDALWEAVLEVIANGTASDPAALAREALRTRDLDFPRYCA